MRSFSNIETKQGRHPLSVKYSMPVLKLLKRCQPTTTPSWLSKSMHSLSCGLPRQAQRVWSQELRLFIPARHNIETSNGKSNCLIIFQLNSDSTPSTHLVISSSRTLSHRDRSDVQRCPLLSRPNGCRAAEHVPPICAGKGQLLGNATEASTRTIRKIA